MKNEKNETLALARKINEALCEAECSASVKNAALLKVRAWLKQSAEMNGEDI